MSEPLLSVRVWDLPTRIFHWLLALCVIGSVVSAKIGGNAMVWHFRLGYVVFALLAFRVLWGLVGGRWSRFGSFIHSPATVVRYLRGQSRPGERLDVGHNPLGALSVLAILGVLAAQVGTGLFADDEISNTGPLIRFVSGATSSLLTSWHKTFGQWLIIGLVLLHIAAIVYYLIGKKRNLVGPMINGDKPLDPTVPPSLDTAASRGRAALLAAACGLLVYGVVSLGG